jgi:hypothetical protein
MTEGQSTSLSWCQAPIWGPRPNFCYCYLRVWFGAPSLKRGRFCPLQLLLTLASAVIFWSDLDHILLSQIRDYSRPDPCIYIRQEQGGPVILPGTGLIASLPRYTAFGWTAQKIPLPTFILLRYVCHTNRVENTASQLLHWYVLRISCGHYLATTVVYRVIS